MTNEEALECVEEVLCVSVHYDETLEYQLTTDDIDWLKKAKKALEKQTAKKPYRRKDEQKTVCPVCGSGVDFDGIKLIYCLDCGQKIDWRPSEGNEIIKSSDGKCPSSC